MNPSDIIKQRISRVNYINYKIQKSDFLNGCTNVVRSVSGTGSYRSAGDLLGVNLGAVNTDIDVLNETLDSTPCSILNGGSPLSTALRVNEEESSTPAPAPAPGPATAPAPTEVPIAPEISMDSVSYDSVNINIIQQQNTAVISGYKYSINGGEFVTVSVGNPINILGLTQQTSYSIIFKAASASGDSVASNSVVFITPTQTSGSLDPSVISGLMVYLNANRSVTGSTWGNLADGKTGLYNAILMSNPRYDGVADGLVFNGTSQYAEIADAAELRATVSQSITVQVWAKVPAASAARSKGLISKQYGSPSYDGYALDFDGTNKVRLRMNGGTVNIIQSASTNNSYIADAWQLFTMVVDFGGSGTLIYVNNSQVLTNTNNETSIPSNTAPIRLASGIQEAGNLLACTIGAMYYYNRALSPTEIVQNFDATKSYYGIQ